MSGGKICCEYSKGNGEGPPRTRAVTRSIEDYGKEIKVTVRWVIKMQAGGRMVRFIKILADNIGASVVPLVSTP